MLYYTDVLYLTLEGRRSSFGEGLLAAGGKSKAGPALVGRYRQTTVVRRLISRRVPLRGGSAFSLIFFVGLKHEAMLTFWWLLSSFIGE
jgi:hypothetical protein